MEFILKSYYKNNKCLVCNVLEFRYMAFLMYYIFNIRH